MELPRELKRLVERYKAKYNIIGEDDEILKTVIPELEDEEIIKIYDELCEEENYLILTKKGYRPNFEKYREEILNYLDDSAVKSEIIKREKRQSSKEDIEQRNYTYISEFANTLRNKQDKIKIINSFYRKVKTLAKERDTLDKEEKLDSIELSIHIMKCIKHIVSKMKIDLVLYRGPDFKKKKYVLEKEYEEIIKKKRRKKSNKDFIRTRVQQLVLSNMVKKLNTIQEENKQVDHSISDEFER